MYSSRSRRSDPPPLRGTRPRQARVLHAEEKHRYDQAQSDCRRLEPVDHGDEHREEEGSRANEGQGQYERISREILYSMVPDSLLLKYIREDSLRAHVKGLIRSGLRFDPLLNPQEKDLRRNLTIRLQKLNHYRKFARYYPEVTDWSF